MITEVEAFEVGDVDSDDPLRQFVLPSVEHLFYTFAYDYPGILTVTQPLKRILMQTPNVSKLTLYLSGEGTDFERFTDFLISVPILEQLELSGCRAMTSDQLEDLVSLLLAPIEGNSLSKFTVRISRMDSRFSVLRMC